MSARKSNHWPIPAGLIVCCACVACGGAENSSPGASLSLVPIERHASLDTLDFRAVGLAWVDDTTVAVIDRDDQQVVFLGLPGGSQRRGAGRGGGPGELESAFMLLGREDGSTLVGDMRQHRASQFDGELEYVRSARVPGMPSWQGDRVVAIWMDFKMTDDAMGMEPMVGEIDLAGGEAREFFSLFDPASGLSRPETDNPMAPPFIAAAMNEAGLILAGQSMEYRIVALDTAGTLHASFGRGELGPDYLSEDEQAAERARIGEAAGRRGPPPPGVERMVDQALEAPQPYFGPGAFSLDRAGRLWVVTDRSRADSTEVDVFAANGDFLTTVALMLAFRGSRLAALVARTAPEVEGVPGVDLYELRE